MGLSVNYAHLRYNSGNTKEHEVFEFGKFLGHELVHELAHDDATFIKMNVKNIFFYKNNKTTETFIKVIIFRQISSFDV